MDYAERLDFMDDDCDIQGYPLIEEKTRYRAESQITRKGIQFYAESNSDAITWVTNHLDLSLNWKIERMSDEAEDGE